MPYLRPDYDTARQEAGFHWSVSGCYLAPMALAGISYRDFNLRPEACIEAYRTGRPRMQGMFGEWLPPLPPATPPVSYGHANCLGSQLLFPEHGEVAHTHPYGSLEEGIRWLQEPVDWARSGMAPFYLRFREAMQAAFPGEKVGFGFGAEGPITTAYELRGEGFFTDLFDQPERVHEFLRRLTDSIVDYARWRAGLDGTPTPNPQGSGMADDIASFVPHHRFAECVLPYWEQYYTGLTTGRRSAHVEDLRRQQLPFLEAIGLCTFDPGISRRLNPLVLRDGCRVPFGWRLGSFHYRSMDEQVVRDFVFQAAADGASSVFTIIESSMCTPEGARKVLAFKKAGEEVERLLAQGCSRQELGAAVSAAGRQRFWARFPE
ncbi:MAG: uroporphyrinogen decarboxylase family protein [Candidatus Latescibacterota bacterium]